MTDGINLRKSYSALRTCIRLIFNASYYTLVRFLSIPENQQLFYRLKSEKVIIEEEAINVKKVAKELETKWVSLTETHGQVIERINKGGFSFDEFERLREKKTLLEAQCHSLTKENQLAQKAAKKWRNKFDKLKYFYRHS